MKKILLFLCILLLTGCDYKELSELSIGTVLGIDKNKDQYVVTCLIVGKEENETNLFNGEGPSITSAINNLNLNLTENLYLNHIQSVIISTDVAEEGIGSILDYFSKSKDVRKNFYLFLAKDVSPENILSNFLETNDNDYNTLTNIFRYHDEIKFTDNSNSFTEFLDTILTKGKEPTLSSITLNEDKIFASDIGIFKNDKLISYSNNTIGYAALNGTAKQIILDVSCDHKKSTIAISNIKTKTEVKNDSIYNTITGDIIMKENNCQFKFKTNKEKKELQKKVEKELLSITKDVISESKKANSDILGYKNLLYKYGKNIDHISLHSLNIYNKVALSIDTLNDKGVFHE